MKLHLRLFASACILLLLPMTGNAIVITYTSNDLGGGIYLTADIHTNPSKAVNGLYSEVNEGLTSFTLSAFDGSGLLDTASAPPSTLYNNFVYIGASGQIEEWFLYASITAGGALFTINDTGAFTTFRPQRVDNVNSSSTGTSAILQNAPGGWSDVPEPGTLALLAAGVGFMYRRKTIGGRV